MARSKRQQALAGFESAAPSRNEPSEDSPRPDRIKAKKSSPATVFVIDAHSLIYQVFHAMPGEMSSPSGQPVGALHGFIRDLLDLRDRMKPDYLFCAFDPPGDVFRHEQYPEYKANRDPMPADLRLQIPLIRQMLDALKIPILEVVGFEADDVLATVARIADQQQMECFLVTSDKDCRQLITDRVKMYNIRRNQVLDADGVMKDWGVRPDQVVDFQALVGDKVDNVPGVALIGPKTAKELLERYGSLDAVLENASDVKGKRGQNLVNGRSDALLSRDLVRLKNDVQIDFEWESGAAQEPDQAVAQRLCKEFGFRQLATRLGTLGGQDVSAADEEPPSESWQADYRLVATEKQLDDLVRQLAGQKRFSVDTETTSTNPRWAEIVGYSFAWQPGVAFYVPVRSPPDEPMLDAMLVRDKLRPILEDDSIEKVGQNLKYDMVVLRSIGIRLQGALFDTMVADYLIDPGERNHGIDDLSRRLLQHNTIKISELIGTGKNQKRMDEVPVAQVVQYAAEDADLPLRLTNILQQRLKQDQLFALFRDLEMPLIQVLAEMEFNGIRVDREKLGELGDRFAGRMATVEQEIYQIAGKQFNIDSRLQLAHVLFEELGLPVVKKTKTGPSTDVDVLTELASQHVLPAKIIEYRQFAKLRSTYVESLSQLVHPETGRVHTSFKQDVAATGRLSSTDPNLQNIPVRTEEGREIRSAFLPGTDGWLLMTADYSQIELRVLAHFSDDDTLCASFANDEDIHARVAAEVHGVPLDDVTSEMRRSAKAVNFGVIYGQSAFGLAKSLAIPKSDAAAFIDAYFARYPGVEQFMRKTLADCLHKGYVKTILGRRRAVSGVRDPAKNRDSRQRNLPERIAINTVIQGSAADLIKLAMLNVHRRLADDRMKAKLLLQIHDELVFELPRDESDRLASLVREEMSNVWPLKVPLKIDVKTGKNWAHCEAID